MPMPLKLKQADVRSVPMIAYFTSDPTNMKFVAESKYQQPPDLSLSFDAQRCMYNLLL